MCIMYNSTSKHKDVCATTLSVPRSMQVTVCAAFHAGHCLCRIPCGSLSVLHSMQVSSSQPICVTVGETPVTSSVSSDWPEPLWECPIPDDVIGTADETTIRVKYDELEAPLVIKKGTGLFLYKFYALSALSESR